MKRGSMGSSKEIKKFSNMALTALNTEINRCLWGSKNAGTTNARKAFFKRLIWLEEIREDKHGIEAPRRNFRKHK